MNCPAFHLQKALATAIIAAVIAPSFESAIVSCARADEFAQIALTYQDNLTGNLVPGRLTISNPNTGITLYNQSINGAGTVQLVFTNVDNDQGNPDEYYLSLNYPNPFRHDTRFTLQFPRLADVSITLYDILGRTVLHERRQAPAGRYDFSLGGLPAGLYIALVKAGDEMLRKKIISLGDEASSPWITMSGRSVNHSSLRKTSILPDERLIVFAPDDSLNPGGYKPDTLKMTIKGNEQITRSLERQNLVKVVLADADGDSLDAVLTFKDQSNLLREVRTNIEILLPSGRYSIEKGSVRYENQLLDLSGLGGILIDIAPIDKTYQINCPNDIVRMLVELYDVTGYKVKGGVIIGSRQFTSRPDSLIAVIGFAKHEIRPFTYSIDADTLHSFGTLHRAIPFDRNYDQIVRIPVVDFNGITCGVDTLVYDTPGGPYVNILNISPQTFYGFAKEGVFWPQNGVEVEGLKGFDFKNRHYTFFVALDQVLKEFPVEKTSYTPEQQQYIAQRLNDYFISSLEPELRNNITIQVATAQDTLPYKLVKVDDRFVKFPAEGSIWVYPSKRTPTYGFKSYDWNDPKDGIAESGKIIVSYVGYWNESAMFTEFNSMLVIGPVYDVNMQRKTMFHEVNGYYSGVPNMPKFSPADQKLVSLVQKMFPESAFREINGKLHLGYQPLQQIDDILSLNPPEGFQLENKRFVKK